MLALQPRPRVYRFVQFLHLLMTYTRAHWQRRQGLSKALARLRGARCRELMMIVEERTVHVPYLFVLLIILFGIEDLAREAERVEQTYLFLACHF
jgi:hypothetical protein